MIYTKKVYMVLALRYKANSILSFWDSREGAESQVNYNNKVRDNKYEHEIREIYIPEDALGLYTIEKNCHSENDDDYSYEIIYNKELFVTMSIHEMATNRIKRHSINNGVI